MYYWNRIEVSKGDDGCCCSERYGQRNKQGPWFAKSCNHTRIILYCKSWEIIIGCPTVYWHGHNVVMERTGLESTLPGFGIQLALNKLWGFSHFMEFFYASFFTFINGDKNVLHIFCFGNVMNVRRSRLESASQWNIRILWWGLHTIDYTYLKAMNSEMTVYKL